MSFDVQQDHADRIARLEDAVADIKADVARLGERVDQGFERLSNQLEALAAPRLEARVAELEGIEKRRAKRFWTGLKVAGSAVASFVVAALIFLLGLHP